MDEIRNYLTNLKIHIDHMDKWLRQATDMVYAIENSLMNIKDAEMNKCLPYKKYRDNDSIEYFKIAASRMYQMIDSPPRLSSSRCSKDHISAAGFYQSHFKINKIV